MDLPVRLDGPPRSRFLAALPREIELALLQRMERVVLPLRHVLHSAGAAPADVWFPLTAVVSLALPQRDGTSVEVATVGKEGFVGLPVALGARESVAHASCQVAGQALKMDAEALRAALAEFPELAALVRRYASVAMDQLAHTTVCNQRHGVQQRMCCWLLMTRDRVGADAFHLTQEFLAQMLAVRRPSVTVAAGRLQAAGLIRYRRGDIRILDTAGLEAHACECYPVVRGELDRLLQGASALV